MEMQNSKSENSPQREGERENEDEVDERDSGSEVEGQSSKHEDEVEEHVSGSEDYTMIRPCLIYCAWCRMEPIVGTRYKSNLVSNYNLCQNCFQEHGSEHGSAENFNSIKSRQVCIDDDETTLGRFAEYAVIHIWVQCAVCECFQLLVYVTSPRRGWIMIFARIVSKKMEVLKINSDQNRLTLGPRKFHDPDSSGGSLARENKNDSDVPMDAKICRSLQRHIGLEEVFAKVPWPEFIELRMVCKDWQRWASERLSFVLHPWYDGYVVLHHMEGWEDHRPEVQLNGILSYNVSSKIVKWTDFDPYIDLERGYAAFTTKGLTYLYNYDFETEKWEHLVYNMHMKVWHRESESPGGENPVDPLVPVVAMAADTSVSPYTFKIVLGENKKRTQIYDSVRNSWTTKSQIGFSHHNKEFWRAYNNVLYLSWPGETWVYDMKSDMCGRPSEDHLEIR